MKITTLCLTTLIFLLIGCTDDGAEKNKQPGVKAEKTIEMTVNTIFSISDYDFTFNNKPAVTLSFGEIDTRFCTLTLFKSSVFEGYKALSESRSHTDTFGVDCTYDGNTYVESSKHPTQSTITVVSIDEKAKKAKIIVSARLIDTMSYDKFLILNNGEININNAIDFDNLVKKI